MAESSSSSSSSPSQQASHRENPAPYDYGGNPLYHAHTGSSARLAATGALLQPGLYKPSPRQIGNPTPLGLAGFAFTTFLLSCVNLNVRGLANPSIVVAPAYAYGGLLQLLAGMWEVALGNTFAATALASYGGFWISIGIILQPGGGFRIASSYAGTDFDTAFGLYVCGWFVFTFLMWLLTLRSTVVFSGLFMMVWLAFVCLAAGYLDAAGNGTGAPNVGLVQAGGGFGIVAAFMAWYLVLAGLLDEGNSFFVIPVLHFPWSEKARKDRREAAKEESGHNV